MHRVIQIQSLKFLEQRQRQAISYNSASTQPSPAAHEAAAANSSAVAAASASSLAGFPSDDPLSPSSSLLPEGAAVNSSTVISIKDFSSSADERSAAALDSALSHEKTITITYHTDKKDGKLEHSAASSGNAKANTSSSAAGSQAALNTAAASKLQSTILIDEVVRRRREKLKRSPRGVWSSLGSAYQMKGEVDVDVGSIGKGSGGIREMTRRKPAGGRAAQGREAGGEATRKVERLIELFRQSRVKMLQTSHDAIREREREREREKEREIQRRENKSRQQLTDAAGSDSLTAADSGLGIAGSGDSLQQPHAAPPLLRMASSASVASTARNGGAESAAVSGSGMGRVRRLDYIARWRQLFDETKQAMDRQLIKRLVERAESRARRMREGVSMEAVEQIISGAARRGKGRAGGSRRRRAAVQHSEAIVAEAEEKTQPHTSASP